MKAARLALAAALAGGGLAAGPAVADADHAARMQYILHCAGCHQADGHGAPDSGVPDMRGQLGHFLKLPEGRAFLVKVPGTSNSALSNREVTRLLNWMVRGFSAPTLPADFAPYTEAEVTTLRSAPLDNVAGERAAIVARLAGQGITIR